MGVIQWNNVLKVCILHKYYESIDLQHPAAAPSFDSISFYGSLLTHFFLVSIFCSYKQRCSEKPGMGFPESVGWFLAWSLGLSIFSFNEHLECYLPEWGHQSKPPPTFDDEESAHLQVLPSPLGLFATPCTVAHRASLSREFSRQEYWGGLPFPSPSHLQSTSQNAKCVLDHFNDYALNLRKDPSKHFYYSSYLIDEETEHRVFE